MSINVPSIAGQGDATGRDGGAATKGRKFDGAAGYWAAEEAATGRGRGHNDDGER